ncbi:MAG: chemotaxis protein CheW [Potamolinea sp.]
MKKHDHLIFSLNDTLYGISTVYVEDIFDLPELTPIPDAPRDIIGLANFRGDLLPVMALNLSFGCQSPDYQLTDIVVILRWEGLRVGIIVNQVHEPREISPEEITTALSDQRGLAIVEQKKNLAGIAKMAGDILILSNPEKLFRHVEIPQLTSVEVSLKKEIQDSNNPGKFTANSSKLLLEKQSAFCPNATQEERAIFRQRAENLKFSVENQNSASFKPIAVIALNGELFGIDLAMVREFTDIPKITPIPCCPTQIIGNTNLRGEILTLVDLRSFLNLQFKGITDTAKVMVVEVEGIVAGVMVEAVYDVMFFLNPLEIMAVSTNSHAINNQYLQGVASYQEKMMSLLDLPKIFLYGGLIVDEAI